MCAKHDIGSSISFRLFPEIAKQMNRPRTMEWYEKLSGKLVQKIDPDTLIAFIEKDDGSVIELPYWRPPAQVNASFYTKIPHLEFWTCSVDYVMAPMSPNNC